MPDVVAKRGTTRTKARKRALDILFEADLLERDVLEGLAAHTERAEPPVRPFTSELVTGETPFDPTPTALRSFCRDRDCRFAAPPGRLRLTMLRKGHADEEIVRSIKLDSDLEITSVPGRRYAAKYIGEGMLIAGGGTALATALVMGLLEKIGQSACDVATSGPDDCDDRSFTSDTAAAVFFAGVGTAAVGAVLRFVVHKRPSLRIKKISRN